MHFLYSSLLINHIITFLFFILPMPFSIINTWKFGILFEFLWPTCCNLYLKRVLSINQCVLKKLNFICVCVLSIWEKIYKNAWLQSSRWAPGLRPKTSKLKCSCRGKLVSVLLKCRIFYLKLYMVGVKWLLSTSTPITNVFFLNSHYKL